MTTASEYLASFVSQAQQHAPSITVATMQRNRAPAGTRNWKPGIGSYGWGINGKVVNDSGGAPKALQFGVTVWFSDRRTNPSASPPEWQQFSAAANDRQRITLAPVGTNVNATIVLLTWGDATLSANSFAFEPKSQQLLFAVPGAGPSAPEAIMAISLHPTGSFGFL
jgi:hypothetical protein